MENNSYTVDVIIPTYKPNKKFSSLLKNLMLQQYPIHKIIIMNTDEYWWEENGMSEVVSKASLDANLKILEESETGRKLVSNNPEIEVHHVKKEEFDHGRTRNRGASYSCADIMVYLTQDAVPKNSRMLEKLLKPFEDPKVAIAYGRQLPDEDCKVIERYTRSFNYPDKDMVKDKKDLPSMGIKTFFCSNVCAAYRSEIYQELGGFIRRTIFNEDMIFAGKAIKEGYKIAYCCQAMVIHSHNYTPLEYMKRNFDLGVSQAEHPEIFEGMKSESEGIKLVKSTAAYLWRQKKPYLIPGMIVTSGFKWIGYRLGKKYRSLPRWMVKSLTMSPSYWRDVLVTAHR